MGMSVVEFIKRKNELIKKHTGMVLVPEDQIEECEKRYLSTFDDEKACPYCQVYSDFYNCTGCPMSKADNCCMGNGNSTYLKIVRPHGSIVRNPDWHNELYLLTEEYNASNKLHKD